MSDFVIHTIPGSPFGRAVLIALEEKGVAYQVMAVAPGTLKSPQHLGLHPFGRIPVMEHGTFRLYESAAILRYIDRVLPQPALTPAEPRAAARMDQIMNVNDWYLFQGVGNVIGFQRVVGPRLMGLTPDESAIAAAMPKAHAVFDVLSGELGEQRYFTGETLSLADLLLVPQMDFLASTPEWAALTANAANLRRWHDRMTERPSLQATTWERVATRTCRP